MFACLYSSPVLHAEVELIPGQVLFNPIPLMWRVSVALNGSLLFFLLPNNSVVQLCLLDDFPPGVSVNESRRGGQAVESDVYSKPLRGHVSSPTLRLACVRGAV